MSKQDFLDKLKTALSGRIAPELVQENINYYADYIHTQIRMGRSEQEVLDSLGDPRLIARTIAETQSNTRNNQSNGYQQEYGYSYHGENSRREETTRRTNYSRSGNVVRMPGWVAAIIVMLVMMLVFTLIFTVLSFLAPILLPIIVVVFFVKLFRDWLN